MNISDLQKGNWVINHILYKMKPAFLTNLNFLKTLMDLTI